jgi:tetratricopeptide (TPR) repeat protein
LSRAATLEHALSILSSADLGLDPDTLEVIRATLTASSKPEPGPLAVETAPVVAAAAATVSTEAVADDELLPEYQELFYSACSMRHEGQYSKAKALFGSSLAQAEELHMRSPSPAPASEGMCPAHDHAFSEHTGLNLATIVSALGDVHLQLAEFTPAKPLYERALALRESALGPAHHWVAVACCNLGNVLIAQGDHTAAEIVVQRALTIRERLFGLEHMDVVHSLNQLGRLCTDQGTSSVFTRCHAFPPSRCLSFSDWLDCLSCHCHSNVILTCAAAFLCLIS